MQLSYIVLAAFSSRRAGGLQSSQQHRAPAVHLKLVDLSCEQREKTHTHAHTLDKNYIIYVLVWTTSEWKSYCALKSPRSFHCHEQAARLRALICTYCRPYGVDLATSLPILVATLPTGERIGGV